MMEINDIQKYQKAQLELLKYVDNICEKNNLTYYLMWGTLIGTIREHGFIPWDADIDIAMNRKDYDVFCDLLIKNKDNDKIFLDHYLTNPTHTSPHAVLRILGTHIIGRYNLSKKMDSKNDGIYIDIFPFDEVSENIDVQKKQIKQIQFRRNLISLKQGKIFPETSTGKKIVKKICKFILSPISYKVINKSADCISRKYNGINSEYVGFLTDPSWYPKQTFKKELFGKSKIADFEEYKFKIPNDAEKILEIAYGDYMQRPPEEERWIFWENEVVSRIDYGEFGEEIIL